MEVFALALVIWFFGYRAHRRRMLDTDAETELMLPREWALYTGMQTQMPTQRRMSERTERWLRPETTLWRPDQTMPWMAGLPTQARMPKPVPSKPLMPKPKPLSKPVLPKPAEPQSWPVAGTHALLLVVTAIAIALLIVGLGASV